MVCKTLEIASASQLQHNRLFAGIPADILAEIGSDMDLYRFDAGDVIFNEGEAGDCLYLVCEGSVCISKAGRGGKQETLGYVQPGNFFGEMALIDGEPRSAQATAADSALLGRVDHAAFEKILSIAPRDLHMNFLRSVVERLRGVNSHFISEMMRAERLSVVGTMANSIVHDIKNPITVILSCSELIAMKSKDPSIREFTTFITKAVNNMLDMTQELLDFARGESSFQMLREPVSSVLCELDSQMNRLIPKNVHLMRDVDCTAELMVDVGRFARMLLNLVKNAMEAMKTGGILRLGVRKEYDRVIFRVSDTGCGMSPELQAKIFEPFVTFGKSGGTGLGMAIAKSVVEAHNGTITVQSELGVGTTIEVAIPVASAALLELGDALREREAEHELGKLSAPWAMAR